MFLKINLNNYKVKEIFKSVLLSLQKNNFSLNNSSFYLIDKTIPDFSVLDFSKLKNNSVIVFNNISKKTLFEFSDFSKLKNKKIIFYFKNVSSLNFVRDFKVSKFSYNNIFFLEKSLLNLSNLFFDLSDLKYNQELFLKKESTINQNDLLLLNQSQKAFINIVNNHIFKETISNTTIKNILKDGSFSRYDGMINIIKAGDFSKAYLETNSMLLSDIAKSISIPMLEIVPKNVKATHAATVEHVTEDQ
ncbi:MAG: SufD family Fe-S cluster assembly protein, partial [archaeon]